MKRRARERLPTRAAGAFPSFLYKSLEELEDATPALARDDPYLPMYRKPLLILSDVELDEALLQRIGRPWTHVLAIHRLRRDPLQTGIVGMPGDLLRNALRQGRAGWGNLAAALEEIATPLLRTLPHDDDHASLHEAWSRWHGS